MDATVAAGWIGGLSGLGGALLVLQCDFVIYVSELLVSRRR
jgi:hypothetical protein